MTVSVREAGPFERLVGFELTDAEIDAAKSAAARRLGKDLKLKGFRPGKAPRPVVEAAVGSARLRSEAIEQAIPSKLSEVLSAEELSPVVNPELENVEDIDGGVSVEIKVTLWPTLDTVPHYRDRKIEVDSPEVTEEELEEQLDRMREQFGQVEEVERPAGEGDFVSVDIEATVDGEDVPEAAATELLYRVGSGGLVEGVDENLTGASAGDVIEMDAPLPEGFDRAGHEARFSLTVNEVKELILPELDDGWVDDNTEFETVGELRSTLRARLEEMKRSQLARRFRDRALETLLDQVEVDLPVALVRAERDELLHSFLHRLEDQDVSIDDYFSATGISQEQFLADLGSQAERSLRTRILLEAVIEDAAIELDDEEVEALLQSIAQRTENPAGFMDAIRGTPQELSLRSDMLRDKALEMILDHATAVDPEGNEIDLDMTVAESKAAPLAGEPVEGEVVEGEVVEAEPLEGEVVEGEILENEATGNEAGRAGQVGSEAQDDQESS